MPRCERRLNGPDVLIVTVQPGSTTTALVYPADRDAVGAAKSIVTTRSWWASGAEMTMVGVIEAGITYGLGLAFASYRLAP